MPRKPIEEAPDNEPEWLFPYHVMDIGDSFFVPTMRPSYMQYIIDVTAKRAGIKVKCYRRVEDKILGVRAWRIG